jgi:NAD(P)-dependent dehydrogenase (short-subunit alcohol dehydrogenase family)
VIALLGARNTEAGQEAAANLTAEGVEARFVAMDVADYASIEAAAGSINTPAAGQIKGGRHCQCVQRARLSYPKRRPFVSVRRCQADWLPCPKAALNMLTVQLAYLLRDTAIKVNSEDPGYTATDLNGHRSTQTVPEGAAEAIRLALLADDGPTGTYSDSKGIVPW